MIASLLFLLLASSLQAFAQISIVGIGDSYASGNGALGFYTGPYECYRSPNSWLAQAADKIGGVYLNRGCSDGVISHLENARVNTGLRRADGGTCPATNFAPEESYELDSSGTTCTRFLQPQLNWVDSTTDLVLIGLGGNDLNFETLVRSCFVGGSQSKTACENVMTTNIDLLPTFEADMTAALLAINAKFSANADSKIVLMTFPHIITEGRPWVEDCCGFSDGNMDIVDSLIDLGNAVQARQLAAVLAANTAAGREFAFLFDQTKRIFAGHEPRVGIEGGNFDGWVHDLNCNREQDSYHLNHIGHEVLGDATAFFIANLYDGVEVPTPAPTPAPGDDDSICFSETATVQVEHHPHPVAMKDLRLGDRVMTNHQTFEPIYGFAHRHETKPATFLKIRTESSKRPDLELSAEHMVVVKGKRGPVRADSVKLGDSLLHMTTDHDPRWVGITRIDTVDREGIYAPLTADGTIVVDGVLASAYAAYQSSANELFEVGGIKLPLRQADVGHVYLSPLRVACQTVSNKFCQRHNNEGMLEYVALGFAVVLWGEKQHAAIQFILLFLGLPVISTIYAMELLLLRSGFGPFILLLIGALACWAVVAGGKGNQKKVIPGAKKDQ